MRVLLINMPTPENESFGGRSTQPLGVAYLASFLRSSKACEVSIIDANASRLSADDLQRLAMRDTYDIFAFSSTTPSFPNVERLAAAAKNRSAATFTIAGGHHVSAVGAAALAQSPSLDAVALGEGELTLAETADAVRSGASLTHIEGLAWRGADGEIHQNPSRHLFPKLDDLPWPARDLLPPLEQYGGVRRWPTLDLVPTATISASRGCQYRCTFCDIQSFFRRETGPMRRVRKPANVVAEMEHVAQTYGAENFLFVDDLFPYAPRWAAAFKDLINEAGIRVTFSFAARADQVVRNPEVLPDLREAGCSSIEMGIESGSQRVLDRYAKDVSVQDNIRAISAIRSCGMRVVMDYIMFDPWSTLEELRESLQFLQAVGAQTNYPTPVYSRLYFYPGTPLFERAAETRNCSGSAIDPWFEDRAVEEVFDALTSYRLKHQGTIDAELEAWREIHRTAVISHDSKLRKVAFKTMLDLRAHPFAAITTLVDAASGQGVSSGYHAAEARTADYLDQTQRIRLDVVAETVTAGTSPSMP